MTRALSGAIGVALMAALGAAAVCSTPVALEPGAPLWRASVRGTGDGLLRQRGVVVLPGLDRSRPRQLQLHVAPGAPDTLRFAVDGSAWESARVPREGLLLVLPKASPPGLRLDLEAAPGAAVPARVTSLRVEGGARPALGPSVFAFVLTLALVLALARALGTSAALAVGCTAGTALALLVAPALAWLSLPASAGRLTLALLPCGLGFALALRAGRAERRVIAHGAALVGLIVFGGWIRGYFLASSGSWDMEYWKAWMMRAVSHGVAHVYGGPDAVPAGHVLAQLRAEEELWRIQAARRSFFVDYPPLAMALWRWSFLAVQRIAPQLDFAETQNVAAKLPAVLGDVLVWPVVLYALRRRPLRGLWSAALYWALPVSWLGSGVLGFLDGAYAPVLALAVVAAGEGRAALAGTTLALACLVKPTGVVAAPAMLVALLAARASLPRAVAAGMAVVAAALLPFAFAGTLATAVVHVYRILFQERLSGGFPNPWWLLGHLLTLGPEGLSGAVSYAHVDLLPGPARALGALFFAAAAAWIVRCQRGRRGAAPALLAAATLVFAYAMLAIGVHENHPHPLFLLLLATGLPSLRLRALAGASATVYVFNMLLLSGLGRFHGLRYAALGTLPASLAAARLALGFDATLLLAVLDSICFAWLLVALRSELRLLEAT